jgi:tRNA dimethylallyltransferase
MTRLSLEPALCLTAPTGCGKTELALMLAERLPLEIVSMDSALVYRYMDIGTAKPPRAVREHVPHHLIDIRDPAEAYSAGDFCRDAEQAFDEIRARGKQPLIVGGTMLYLRALRDGLAELPARDERIRRELDAEAEARGWAALHGRLAEIDPDAAARIAPNDRQRIQRALEVHAATGRTLTELKRRGGRRKRALAVLALVPQDRPALAGRLAARFDAMVEAGFVDEVRRLRARGDLDARMSSIRSVGYRQIWAHLDGKYEWRDARERAIVATRQLAKRQLTWLRGESEYDVLPAFGSDTEQRVRRWVEQKRERL